MEDSVIKYRPHRGSLQEAMAEVVTLPANYTSLLEHVRKTWSDYQNVESVNVTPYCYDERIDWNTFIVLARFADKSTIPVGFTNGPLENELIFRAHDQFNDVPVELTIPATFEAVCEQVFKLYGYQSPDKIVIAKDIPGKHSAHVLLKYDDSIRVVGCIDWLIPSPSNVGTVTFRAFSNLTGTKAPSPIDIPATTTSLLNLVKRKFGASDIAEVKTVRQELFPNQWMVVAIHTNGNISKLGFIDGPVYNVLLPAGMCYGVSELHFAIKDEANAEPPVILSRLSTLFTFEVDDAGNGFTSGELTTRPFQVGEHTVKATVKIDAYVVDNEVELNVTVLKITFESPTVAPGDVVPEVYCCGYRLLLDLATEHE